MNQGDATAPGGTSSPQTPNEALPALEIPGFRLIHKLGQGGMGSVFLYEDIELERPVAVKINAPSLAFNETQRQRFRREARTMAQLDHPNLARVFSFGEIDSRQYLVMEYLEGETLTQRVQREKSLGLSDAIDILIDITRGLEAAWKAGIVHRDLKPDNVILAPAGLKIVDFGLARDTEGATKMNVTSSGELLGSFRYMAPERVEGEIGDHQGGHVRHGAHPLSVGRRRAPLERRHHGLAAGQSAE